MNRCHLCERDKDGAMLLVQCAGQGRQVCGTCAGTVAQSLLHCHVLERRYDNRNDPALTALRQIVLVPPGAP